ncbi:MAG: SURF1 family protein [Acidimicrobiales bacterium]
MLRPRWILLHLLIVVLVAVMISLGFWQLRRLDERRRSNAEVRSRTSEQPVAIESVANPGTDGDALTALRYRAVTARGEYVASASTVVASRTQDGVPGSWIVTPMRVATGTVLIVRGFARLGADGTTSVPSTPSGTVDVDGYALAIGGFDNIAKHDLEALRHATPGAFPVVVQAKASRPSDDAGLATIALPSLDDGPHLSYAVQWFLFASIAALGYPFALRRAAGQRSA